LKFLKKNRNKFLLTLIFFLFCIYYLLPKNLFGDEYKSFDIELSIPQIQKLAIIESRTFPEIIPVDINKGYAELLAAVTISFSSNVPWQIVILSPQKNLYKSAGKYKPIEHFLWSSGSNDYQPVTSGFGLVSEGKKGVKEQRITINYRLKLNWEDAVPGDWQFKPEFRIINKN